MHKSFSNREVATGADNLLPAYFMRFPPQESIINAMIQQNKIQPTRPFIGMNPNIKPDAHLKQVTLCQRPYIFDSDFESGNLDMVVQKKPRDFELYMRVDTNARGHH